MLRLFAALPVPGPIASALRPLQTNLSGASWRPLENFHITLCFYGDVETARAHDLDDLLAEIDRPVFDLIIEGMGWFGRREPAAVWARIRESDELRALAGQCEKAARRLGIPLERRPYTPHITLAYLHGTPLDAARAWTEAHQTFRAGPFPATHFHLYSSQPRSVGPTRYVPEADYPLADPFSGFISPEETY